MAIFSFLYQKMLTWSQYKKAEYYLVGLTIAEACFFPLPPDIMLASMVLANREKAWRYAALTTVSSVFGGILGYLLGAFALHLAMPVIDYLGYHETYLQVNVGFKQWGFWIICIAGFSPIPYKLFTVSAGVLSMPLLPFIVASIVARGARFYLVAALLYWRGPQIHALLGRYIDLLGWLVTLILISAYLIYR